MKEDVLEQVVEDWLHLDGWFTVHQPLRDGQSVEDAIREAAGLFRPLF